MTQLLSTANLTWMQATQQQAMPGTVVIERYTSSADGMGGETETWAAVGTAIGRIYPHVSRGMNEAVGGAQIMSVTNWNATLPIGTDVVAQDRLLYQSRTWEVLQVNNDEMWQTAVRCEVKSMNEERRV